jgi:putative membrane protein
MKTIPVVLFLILLFLSDSCSTKKTDDAPDDAKEVAEEQNEAKFDDTNLEDVTEFAVNAADAGMMEVQAGSLALTKASSANVKEFAQSMIDDHAKANEELKALAQGKNISLPPSLSDKCQKKYNDLMEKSGNDFDKAYAELMVKDHKDVVDMFKKASDNAKDQDLKNWAIEKLPALQHHLEMAEALEKSMK